MSDLQNKIITFVKKINESKGTSNNYPGFLKYNIENNDVIVELCKENISKKEFRRFDSWALAFVVEAEEELNIKINKLIFNISNDIDNFKYDFEAFKRRVSFLNINNENIDYKIIVNKKWISLYDKDSLFQRPENEIIRTEINDRTDTDKGDLLEKAFQAFLFGKDLGTVNRTNDRLAILGEHFYKSKGKECGVLREFPTGVFNKLVKEENRLTRTEYVDLVTINKYGNLSVIELKLDNSELEVISQILDYALFFRCYINQLSQLAEIKNAFGSNIRKEEIFCYVVNNYFHPRFDRILKYYSTKNKPYNFQLIKILLGDTKPL